MKISFIILIIFLIISIVLSTISIINSFTIIKSENRGKSDANSAEKLWICSNNNELNSKINQNNKILGKCYGHPGAYYGCLYFGPRKNKKPSIDEIGRAHV